MTLGRKEATEPPVPVAIVLDVPAATALFPTPLMAWKWCSVPVFIDDHALPS
jgi:hypothetical protein